MHQDAPPTFKANDCMTERKRQPELGLVIPCYNEEEVLPKLIGALDELALGLPMSVLFVDDGSADGTAALLLEACRQRTQFAVLTLSRNFGHQTAVTAGLRHVRGDIVAVLDADMQDPPALLAEFVEKWRAGYDVVYGIRTDRKESWPLRAAYHLFYRLLKRVSDIDIPKDAGDFALMDRKVVEVINAMPEHNRFVRGLRKWAGFRQTGLPYTRPRRQAGRSKYNVHRLTRLAFDGLLSFSSAPLRLSAWLGVTAAVLGFCYLVFAIFAHFLADTTPEGWTSTMAVILLLGGIQLVVLGIIGEYVGRIFEEVKNRPHFVVRSVAGWLED